MVKAMIVKPVGDFKKRRKQLHPSLQTGVDDLVKEMSSMALLMCELSPQYQLVQINLDSSVKLQFVLSNSTKALYIMFV